MTHQISLSILEMNDGFLPIQGFLKPRFGGVFRLCECLPLAAGNSRLAIEHKRLPMYIRGVHF